MAAPRIDFAALAGKLHPETLVPQWLPDGRRSGREWVARNPTRTDRTPGSFSISLQTGAWADFATGDEGGDLISLWAYLHHGKDQLAAARDLIERHGLGHVATSPEPAAASSRPEPAQQPTPIIPIPAGIPDPDFRHPTHGAPSQVWCYYTAQGERMLFVCRFDHADGSKDIAPLSWCSIPGRPDGWRWRGIAGLERRPLYGLDRLAALPEGDVLIVEGEKSADAAHRLVGDAIACVAWLGGTACADRVKLAPLRGRRVILWPDFDRQRRRLTPADEAAGLSRDDMPLLPIHEQPGVAAMVKIAQGLAGIASSVHMVGYDPASDRFAPGWDIADAEAGGWRAQNVLQFLELHAADPFAIAGGRVDPAPDPAPAPDPLRTEPDEAAQVIEAANDNRAVPLDQPLNPFAFPHVTDKGSPQNTIENIAHLLREYGISACYNVISKDIELRIPGRAFSIDNRADASLAVLSSLCARNRVPKADLSQYLAVIADANPVNPAGDWITSRAWDGVDRLDPLVRTLDPHDRDLALILVRRWLIGAVACALDPEGFAMQGVLVVQGPQYAGKTTWFRTLCGGDHRLFKEGAQLNPADRDSVKQSISHWIVELGEIDATFRKADIAALKPFFTRDRDEVRLPYGRGTSVFPRRTAYVATVNPDRFLRDETGNRRYWTVKHGPGLVGQHSIDVQQVWAQAAALWRAGEPHRLTRDEMDRLNLANAAHTEATAIDELIVSRYDWSSLYRPSPMTATEVLIAIGFDRPTNPQTREAGNALRRLTGGEPRKSNGRYVFDLPPKMGDGMAL